MNNYLVILDSRSAVGAIYLNGNNDGLVTDGTIKHPLLLCSKIEFNNPLFLFVIRPLDKEASQSIYLPYGSIVAIHQFAEGDKAPLGFSIK